MSKTNAGVLKVIHNMLVSEIPTQNIITIYHHARLYCRLSRVIDLPSAWSASTSRWSRSSKKSAARFLASRTSSQGNPSQSSNTTTSEPVRYATFLLIMMWIMYVVAAFFGGTGLGTLILTHLWFVRVLGARCLWFYEKFWGVF